ncbi:MAG: GumC family protein [Candidatus Entotheonellia bacterium]
MAAVDLFAIWPKDAMMTPLAQNRFTVQDYLQIVRRRKWWLIFIFIIGTTLTVVYSYALPLIYRSSTLILVDPQKIPAAYVSSTVTSSVQERLSTISQEILSRTNLEKIITQFGLYEQSAEGPTGMFDKVSRLLRDGMNLDLWQILGQFNLGTPQERPPLEMLVGHMRNDIEVQVTGGGKAFTVSYNGRDPLTVMKVTNTLATLFIEQNLKLRELQAEGTSEFLEYQLAEAKRQLEKQEQALKEFKELHMGALPPQMDANLRTLDRLQLELQSVGEALKTAEERKISLEKFRIELKNIDDALRNIGDGTLATPPGGTPDGSTLSLPKLREELAKLQTVYNDNYPDVIVLKSQIREAEAQSREATTQPTETGVSPLSAGQSATRDLSRIGGPSPELLTLNAELESLRRRRERILGQTQEYEKRVEQTFANEQNLYNYTRDYETSQRNYQQLLDKRLNAKISENLEKRQKSEQFRILDPANLPQKPYKPDRRKIILLGSLLSAGLGIGVVLLNEYISPSYRRPEDFHGAIDLPILATIPRIKNLHKGPRYVIALQEPDSMIAEQYRILYTKIAQVTKGNAQGVFAISSAVKNEGKTLTALNLALVMARDFGKKTLLVEGDFKNPAISTYTHIAADGGLSDILLNKSDIQSTAVTFGHDNLVVLPMVKSVKNSVGLLSSQEMSKLLEILKERYDFVLIDSPPVLALPDMNIIERLVDGIILVVRAEKTPQHAVVTAIESLATDKLIGIILNDMKQLPSRYYRYSYSKA